MEAAKSFLETISTNRSALALGVAATVGVGALLASNSSTSYELSSSALHNHTGATKYSIKFDENCYGGRIFAESFNNHGVKFVFTLTGGHISPILVGCKEMGIRVIDVRHEVNAVFAADAVSRLSGIPGVAVVTAGPGLTNTVTAVKNAQMAQSPLILVGGATSDLLKGKGSLQDIDQFALLKPHVKWATHVNTIREIAGTVEKAFQVAQEGVPGPVFIEVPLDVLYKEKTTKEFYEPQIHPRNPSLMNKIIAFVVKRHLNNIFYGLDEVTFHAPLPYAIPVASSSQVAKVLLKLKTAQRPVLMIGSQAMLCADAAMDGSLVRALHQLNIPTVLSGMARGVLGKHPLHIRHKEARRKALREADVVILAGVVCDFRLDYGKSINSRAFLISVNRDTTDLKKNRTPAQAIHGDPSKFLLKLAEAVEFSQSSQWIDWHTSLTALDQEKDEQIQKDAEAASSDDNNASVNPIHLCAEVERHAHDNSIFIADGGDFVGTASYILRPRAPLCWMDPGPFGTLGVGTGFALGAKLVRPEAEVWTIFGDGAVGFSIAEFDTLVRHNVNVLAVVGNDAAWMQILRGQLEYFNDDVGGSLAPTHYEQVVEGFGAKGVLIRKPSEVVASLQRAKEEATKHSVLVNALIGRTNFRAGSLAM